MWGEVDPAAGIPTVRGDRMQAGRDHGVPLTAPAPAILGPLPRTKDGPDVFPAPRCGMRADVILSAAMRRMRDAEEKAGHPGHPSARYRNKERQAPKA